VPLCRFCEPLIEASTSVRPHGFLAKEEMKRDFEGTLERYACRECGTAWERFRPRPHIRDRQEFWRIIGRAARRS
jgi:hypothetical protein